MLNRRTRVVFTAIPLVLAFMLALSVTGFGQTNRGALNGIVTDQSGAVVPGALVEIVDVGTSASTKAVSSSAGEFSFIGLEVGSYTVKVSASGFKPEKIQGVPVSAGTTYTLPVKLGIASAGETVEVSADALALDTTTTVETTDIPSETVQNTPMNGRDFTQLIAVTPGYAGYSGGGYGSVNGSRPDMVNWQIEGADNNDVWWNIPAANQGGISGIAGVTLPLDAIEQVSTVTEAGPDIGRSPGATVNLSIKSGTNQFHGSAYYYNRNEALAAKSQLSVVKPELRNQQFGYSAGGPIWRDKLFFFTTYEDQRFLIGVNTPSTEPSAAYQAGASSILAAYGVPVNQTALNLLNGNGSNQGLWPAAVLNGPATPFNYLNPENEVGWSHNGLAKLDYTINDKNKLSAKWYVGQGPQIAPTVSLLTPYYEVGPMHVQNYNLTWNSVFSPRIANQLFAGVNYYNQSFSDASDNYQPVALGLNTGVSSPSLAGAPRIQIAAPTASSGLGSSSDGFDYVGATVDSGRNDITGHLDETLSWTVGKHQLHFGGEFRQAQIDDFYQADQRGTFNFDGTQGPWAGNAGTACDGLTATAPGSVTLSASLTSDPRFLQLADFLAGCFDAGDTSIVQGDPKRQVFLNSYGIFAQDTFQVTPTLNLNYGLRYEYSGPVHSQYNDLTTFLPGAPNGLATVGVDLAHLYPQYHGGWGPRVGFTWQPGHDSKTVIRGGFGLGYDNPNIVNFLNSRFSSNGGAFGVQDNPSGSTLAIDTGPSAPYIPSGASMGAPIFPDALSSTNTCITEPSQVSPNCSSVNVFSVSQKLRPGYLENFNLNLQRSLGNNLLAQIGYVGSAGRRLRALLDINQAALGSGGANSARPFYSLYPNYGVINQIQSVGTSDYNGLQATLRVASWHGITSQVAYTWAHSLDEASQIYLYNPQNSLCFKCDYGNSDFDVRNTAVTYVTYMLPNAAHGPKLLTNGWQVNGLLSFHGGQPFSIFSSNSGGSGTGEFAERANLNAGTGPYAGVSHSVVGNASTGYSVNWMNPNAYSPSANGAFGDSHRNDLHGPGFSDVDFSVFKNTKVGEWVTTQFRVEMFNLFNRLNLAAPGDGFCTDSQTCAIGTTIGANYGAPGIGAGEPFNTQLALKIIF
ncbi:MAG: TonB-dependent receptor domain-containing protein [Terracidiphilus sp.]